MVDLIDVMYGGLIMLCFLFSLDSPLGIRVIWATFIGILLWPWISELGKDRS